METPMLTEWMRVVRVQKYNREIENIYLHLTIRPRSNASRLPGLVVVLPLVLCRLSFSSLSLTTSHRALLELWCGRFLSTSAVCRVTLSSRRCLPFTGASTSPCAIASSLYCPLSCLVSAMAGCCVESDYCNYRPIFLLPNIPSHHNHRLHVPSPRSAFLLLG
jgi:hypothetical protein